MKKFFLFLIKVYQKTFSPDHGVTQKMFPFWGCKYYPSCSEYTKECIKKHGVFKGVVKGFWRILRCNPWSNGGVDMP